MLVSVSQCFLLFFISIPRPPPLPLHLASLAILMDLRLALTRSLVHRKPIRKRERNIDMPTLPPLEEVAWLMSKTQVSYRQGCTKEAWGRCMGNLKAGFLPFTQTTTTVALDDGNCACGHALLSAPIGLLS